MINRIKFALITGCLLVCVGAVTSASAQLGKVAKVANPELIGQLTQGLGVTPEQATGGAGALFGYAKTQLKPADFKKVANVVPGMDGLLKAAPKAAPKAATSSTTKSADVLSSATSGNATDMISSVGGMLPGKMGGIASLAGSFGSLGLSPEMIGKFVPIMSQYVNAKGGAGVANILGGVLK